jgi:microsomal epoxide hydrolase
MRSVASLPTIVLIVLACQTPQGQTRPIVVRPSTFGSARSSPDAIVPFKIHVSDRVLRDLRERLARTRFPDEIDGAGWDYGNSLAYMKELVAYWRDRFDWRKQERELNKFDQFTTNIDGLDLHFIHHRSSQPNALPLVITHGYPGSIAEFTKVIGPFTDPGRHGGRSEDAFHVVAISMPGYGFSGHPRTPGIAHERIAAMIIKLMARLGYARYGVQGGDHGAPIGRLVALNDASHVAGLHLNLCTAPPPPGDPTLGVPAVELARMREREAFFEPEATGWVAIQQRQPQTLGYALNDSPVGLAAWILHNFRALCGDCNGDVEKKFTKDELLTNITIYWATESITSAMRLYRESRLANRAAALIAGGAGSPAGVRGRRVEVPTGCAIFPGEGIYSPRRWVEASHNLVHWTEMPRGGHFASMEEPGLFVDDVRAFFRGVR